jgi:predicted dehydrogenase
MAVTRRQFLQQSAAAAGWAVPLVIPSRAWGAQDEIRAGVVGLGGRGRDAHVPGLQEQPGVTIVAISDPDRQRMAQTAEAIQSRYGHKVDQYVDMRQMFDRADIDVIGNATQNYWHALSTIWACQAGKHVYVEKPLSHYIWEGRQMVHAARRYDRLVQVGTQHRSEEPIAKAIQWIREGHLGKIKYVLAFANKQRASCGKRDVPLTIPEHVD